MAVTDPDDRNAAIQQRGDAMKMPDFLMARAESNQAMEKFAIGETGFSFNQSQRPATSLTEWFAGDAIPDRARRVLENGDLFSGITGLLSVQTETDAANEVCAEWILARCTSGLLSIVVRDETTCRPEQLLEDVAFAAAEAERFCASSVIMLVLENDQSCSQACCAALQSVFESGPVIPNVLYRSNASTKLPVWFARLSRAS